MTSGWTRYRILACVVAGLLTFGTFGCEDGDDGAPGPAGKDQPIRTKLDRTETLPGLVIEILGLSGGSGPGGNFRPGDTMSVRYTVKMDDGTAIPLDELDRAAILVSGPSHNYQPVLGLQGDMATASTQNADGSHTYRFSMPIPATYQPPLNDTASFGPESGELQGQALLDGTYTVGIEMYKLYTVGTDTVRDADNATQDFLMGGATQIEAREVVKVENCNQCHAELRAHGTFRRDVKHCLLCHTPGAEDKNVASAAGGTPGLTIDFKVMIHKIHNGGHLPSVLGVATNPDGTRNYAATAQPYKIVGHNNSVHDFSDVTFPVWPNLSQGMPRDAGYSALSSAAKSLETKILRGAATCSKCHGDPDGAGPITAPAQGQLAYSNPERASCGSCHDDIDWSKPYTANLTTMPPQPDDSACTQCHPASSGLLAVTEAHTHPLHDPAVNPGLVFNITNVAEAGTNDGDGTLDPGEKVRVSFTTQDSNQAGVDASTLDRMEFAISGPTNNRNILAEAQFPVAALSGASNMVNIPETVLLEFVGTSTATGGESFTTARTPHWNMSGAQTSVLVRTATAGGSSTLSAAASQFQNYVDVADASNFARGDYVVIEDGVTGKEEYLRIQWVDGTRLWFSSIHSPYSQPWVRTSHASGVAIQEVTLTSKTVTTDYTLNATTGTITEVTEFGAGNDVLVSYTTDFIVPQTYAGSINDTPDLGETFGEWTGKSLAAGTYEVGLWGERGVSVVRGGETTSYTATARGVKEPFLVGSATTITPANIISGQENCYSCHNEVWFHGQHRRGFDTCIMCHGTAGSEDRPRYVAANAPATTGVSIDFRRMLHKIHMGADLANASSWEVIGFGMGYPNNFSVHTYEKVHFPSMLGGAADCSRCHGAGNTAWKSPAARNHPTQQGKDTRSWFVACGSCHNGSAAQAHMETQTAATGAESCAVCHGTGKDLSVEVVHRTQ